MESSVDDDAEETGREESNIILSTLGMYSKKMAVLEDS